MSRILKEEPTITLLLLIQPLHAPHKTCIQTQSLSATTFKAHLQNKQTE